MFSGVVVCMYLIAQVVLSCRHSGSAEPMSVAARVHSDLEPADRTSDSNDVLSVVEDPSCPSLPQSSRGSSGSQVTLKA